MTHPTQPPASQSLSRPHSTLIGLPAGASINIDWHGDDRVPIATAGDLLDMLSLVGRDTPVWLAMDPQHGTVDHLQIGGAATWL